jgi:iron complex outermembrane receptor protein
MKAVKSMAKPLIPLVGRDMVIPLVEKLTLEGAVRYVDNSLAGGDITWTAGARYSPIRDLELRGNYTRSIRAPAITELFLPNAQILSFANDPCDTRFINQGNAPSRRAANCATAGITQPFSSNIVNASKLINVRGNDNLENEQARSWTAGAIVTPRFLPGFLLSADWVDIRLTNAIASLNATTLLQACYDSASYPSAAVCSQFTRDSSGQISSVTTGYVNAGSVHFAGLTANMGYSFDIGKLGRLALNANYQYTKTLDFSITGTDHTENAGQIGNSRHKASASLTWVKNGFTLFGQGIFIGKAVFDNSDKATTRSVSGVGNWIVFNMATSYDIQKNLSLQFSVNNVADRGAPPYSVLSTSGITTYFAGILGRTYSVSARMHF